MTIDHIEEAEPSGFERTARLLGYVGLFPFVLMSIWLAAIARDHLWHDGTILLLKIYAAIVLSFLGGVRWGLAMARKREPNGRDLFLATAAPLAGWIGSATPAPYAFALLAAAFAAHGAWDTIAAHRGKAPDWYARQRTLLTPIVVATMVLAFAATA